MKRILTALTLIPVVVGLVWWVPGWLMFLAVLLVVGLSLHEYLELAARMGHEPLRLGVYSLAFVVCLLGWQRPGYLFSVLVAALFLLLGGEVLGRENPGQVLAGAAIGQLGLIYVVLPFVFLLRLRAEPSGHKLVFLVLVLTWVGDAAAYYGGSAVGRHKLAPQLSPGKTIEGAAASLVATLGVGFWLTQVWFSEFPRVHAVALPVALNLASQVGDLVESALKRGAGVKDSSQLLPGHGGMLDRVDALLLAFPTLWYYYFFLLRD